MKIGLAQLNSIVGDLEGNKKRILTAYQQLSNEGADLIVTPELALIGYPPQDILLQRDFFTCHQHVLASLSEELQQIGITPLLLGTITQNQFPYGPPFHNSALLLQEGKILQTFEKQCLPSYDIFEEHRYFQPGENSSLLELGSEKIGVTICADLWDASYLPPELTYHTYQKHPLEKLCAAGATCIINLNASPFESGKQQKRLQLLQKHAQESHLPILYCNSVGGHDGILFDGHSIAMAAEGQQWEQLPHCQEATRLIETDSLKADSFTKSASNPKTSLTENSKQPQQSENKTHQEPISSEKLQQLYEALVMGIHDYVTKSGFQRVLLGLSGGIDSALVATLATAALGPQNVTAVMLPGPYSSEGSLLDAQALIDNLGLTSEQLPITPLYQEAMTTLQENLSDPSSIISSLTQENLQARLRGLLLMALSNQRGALLLTTGNKSELAVGYCTLYGDMCGSLSVIGDLFKTTVYELAHWINRDQEIIPNNTLTKPPSAELRPNQSDQDSLPEYELLDTILRLYIEEKQDRAPIIAQGYPAKIVDEIIKLVNRNEYKRKQAPPILKVTSKAFGTGRHWPIVGNYFFEKNN